MKHFSHTCQSKAASLTIKTQAVQLCLSYDEETLNILMFLTTIQVSRRNVYFRTACLREKVLNTGSFIFILFIVYLVLRNLPEQIDS